MRTPHWLGMILLALVAGVATGWLARGGDETLPSRPAAAPLADPDGSREGATGPLASTPVEPTNASAPPATAEPAPVNPAGSQVIIDGIVLPEPITGDGKVTVLVADLQGAPVEGLELSLATEGNREELKYPRRADFDTDEEYMVAKLRHSYVRWKLEQQATHIQTSDVNGRIEFVGLPGEHAQLSMRSQDFLLEGRTDTMSRPVKVGEEITLTVARARQVEVLVEGATSRSCRVSWTFESRTDSTSVTVGKSAKIRLPLGRVEIRADAGSSGGRSEPVVVEVNDSTPAVVLKLGTDAVLTGVVKFEGPRPRYYSVYAAKVVAGATDAELLQDSRSAPVVRIEVDQESGKFVVSDELEGEYVIGVKGESKLLCSSRIVLGDSPMELELEVPAPVTNGGLIVNVEHPKDVPVENVQFTIRNSEKNRIVSVSVWIYSNTRFLVIPIWGDSKAPPQEAIVGLHIGRLGYVEKDFRPGVDTEVNLKFEAACQVTLSISNPPAGSNRLALDFARAPEFDRWQSASLSLRASRSAEAELGAFQPGLYRFRLRSEYPYGWVLAELDVTLKAGEQSIEIAVPELHSVLLDGSGCSPYTHGDLKHVESDVSQHFTFNDNGNCLLGGLPPGTYEVSYTANGIHGKKQKVTFSLPGAEKVILTGG